MGDLRNSNLVTIRSFASEPEANIARGALEAFGIDCTLSSDDCGGQRIHLAITEGIRLLVRAEDAESAEQVLTTPPEPQND